jgi:hypothetical protein
VMAQPKKRDPWARAMQCETLKDAHEALVKLMPKPDADAVVWRTFHLRSASVCERVAEVDRGHHHEALYWSKREREKAERVVVPPAEESGVDR